jgi:hypothetical protein
MKHRPQLISDAQLEQLAADRGPASAEAYIVLELREARSSGDLVAAFQADGRYTVRSAPEQASKTVTSRDPAIRTQTAAHRCVAEPLVE